MQLTVNDTVTYINRCKAVNSTIDAKTTHMTEQAFSTRVMGNVYCTHAKLTRSSCTPNKPNSWQHSLSEWFESRVVIVKSEVQPQRRFDRYFLATSTNIRLTVYHLPTTENDQNNHCFIQVHQNWQHRFIPNHEDAELRQIAQQAWPFLSGKPRTI